MNRVFVVYYSAEGERHNSETKNYNMCILTFNKESFKTVQSCILNTVAYSLAFKVGVQRYTPKTHVGKDPENFRSRAST